MNIVTAVKTLWRYRQQFGALREALTEAQHGEYQQAKHTALTVIEPLAFAVGSAVLVAAGDYGHSLWNGYGPCFEASGSFAEVGKCWAGIHWKADLFHLLSLSVSVAATTVVTYRWVPKKGDGK